MNILYITHRIPYPPNKGEKIRAFHQLRQLAKKHAVHLACLVDDPEDLQHVSVLEQYCASVDVVYRSKVVSLLQATGALLTASPLSVASFYSRKLATKIRLRLQTANIDRIIVFSSAMAAYVRHVSDIPKIMDFVDVDSEKWRLYTDYHSFPLSWVYKVEANRLARYEEEVAREFAYSLFVSQTEAELFAQRIDDRPIGVIPNGVDLEYFIPPAQQQREAAPVMVFTGAMDYFPNVDAVGYFCREILPLIRSASPKVRFSIVGRNPTNQVKDLAHLPNVTVSGTVPDIRPYLAEATLAIAPFRIARGIPNKVLEAMAMGLPVIGTTLAFQGIQATTANGIRTADEPQAFAREVLSFLTDAQLQRRCALQARQYVEQQHRWEDCGDRLAQLLDTLAVDKPTLTHNPSLPGLAEVGR